MGFALAHGNCICCGHPFAFNPVRVPSTSALTGQREPVCQGCMAKINAKRRSMGLEPFPIAPDAYEACDESEL